jgi:hypothetical protein
LTPSTVKVREQPLSLIYDRDAQNPDDTAYNGVAFSYASNNRRISGALGGNNRNTKALVVVDFSEEEDRDNEAIKEFMKRYAKLWRNIFAKYYNSGAKVSHTMAKDFAGKAQERQCLTSGEMTKLMRDHSCMPQLMSRDEVNQLFKLVNTKLYDRRTNLLELDYDGYLTFIVQFAINGYARGAKDLSFLPPIESLKALID